MGNFGSITFPLTPFAKWGDKDTFGIAFAMAGKAHLFSQVAVPPGEHRAISCIADYDVATDFVLIAAGLFSWRENMLVIKSSGERQWGWQLFGFLQHDTWGRCDSRLEEFFCLWNDSLLVLLDRRSYIVPSTSTKSIAIRGE